MVLRPPATVCAGNVETLLLAGEQAIGHADSCPLEVLMIRDNKKPELVDKHPP
jgi:hypothetical protein